MGKNGNWAVVAGHQNCVERLPLFRSTLEHLRHATHRASPSSRARAAGAVLELSRHLRSGMTPSLLPSQSGRVETSRFGRAQVAVVGAGLAGLTAGLVLARAAADVTVYEASARLGGRVRSVKGAVSPEIVTELGAEFIDSTHTELLSLAHEFQLPIIDTAILEEKVLAPAYCFGGNHYTDRDVIEALHPFAQRIRKDALRLSGTISHKSHSPVDAAFDRISIAEYLDRVGMNGWVRLLLDVAYATEYGLDTHDQSSLNLLKMLSLDMSDGFKIFGSSDQRYKIDGGNDKLTQALGAELSDRIQLEHTLLAVRDAGAPRLEFDTPGGPRCVTADFVIFCVPFSVLRGVDLPKDLPGEKKAAINNLGYGTNEKVIIGVNSPLWRGDGWNGDAYTDLTFQTGWDSGRMQRASGGAYTFYLGGAVAARLGSRDRIAVAQNYANEADALFAGMARGYTGASVRTDWGSSPLSRGAYSCYRPGQWTTIAGAEFEPVGNLYFAGEHCSREFQGFMNGAVETGRRAAEAILLRVR